MGIGPSIVGHYHNKVYGGGEKSSAILGDLRGIDGVAAFSLLLKKRT